MSPADDRSRELGRRGAERLLAAGERAVERRDAPTAETLLTRAITLLTGDDPLRPRALWALAEAVVDGGEYGRAAGILREAEDAATGTGQPGLAQRARLWRLYAGVHAGEVAGSDVLAEATAAVEVFGRLGDEGGLADALALRGRIRFWEGAAAVAEMSYEESLSHARAAGARRRETETLAWLIGAKAHGPTPAGEAIVFCDEILAGARRDPLTDLFAWEKRGQLLAMRGEFDEGRESVRRARAIAEEFGLALRYAYSADYVARVELLAGGLETAERELRDALSRLDALGEKASQQQLAWQLAEVLYRRGSFAEARAFAPADDAAVRARRAKILARLGETDEAASLAADVPAEVQSSDLLDENGVALRDVAEALALLGDTAGAVASTRRARELFERKGNVVARAEADVFLRELVAPSGDAGTIAGS